MSASTLTVVLTDGYARKCGGCTLCCKLLPMLPDLYPPEQVAKTWRGRYERTLGMVDFVCCECTRHVSVVGPGFDKLPEPRLCAACLMMPGWTTIPLLRERLGGVVGDCVMQTNPREEED